jgi:hypothetical protein
MGKSEPALEGGGDESMVFIGTLTGGESRFLMSLRQPKASCIRQKSVKAFWTRLDSVFCNEHN